MAQGDGRQRVHRRHAAAGMDEDRDPRLARDREDRGDGRVVERERLRARVHLEAPCSERQAAPRLVDRVVGRIEAAVGNDPAAAVARPREHPVVGSAIGRTAVGLVQRERARPRFRPNLIEQADQRLGRQPLAVLVLPEVGVRVENGRARRPQATELLGERRVRGLERCLRHAQPFQLGGVAESGLGTGGRGSGGRGSLRRAGR